MLASDSMIAVLTTNTFVQVKVFSYLFFLDYLLMNTADHKLIKEEFFYYCLDHTGYIEVFMQGKCGRNTEATFDIK